MVGIFVANTDHDWFDFLAAQPGLQEANFWRPSPQPLQAIGAGELFAFRLKSPRDRIGGFGVLSTSTVLPLQVAWEAFGAANGVPSYDALEALIGRYRSDEPVGPTTNICCNALVETVFLPPELWFDVPESWSRNIVWGKRFSVDEEEGRNLWDRLHDAAKDTLTGTVGGLSERRYGEPTLITPRLGQSAFRVAVTEAYGRQCALTPGKVLPALDAAHIVPYRQGGLHSKSNGILLRKDIHAVFDAGYATFDSELRFVVSDKVREVYDNGEEYRRLRGVKLRAPTQPSDGPDPVFLRWHNENRFLG